jgi:hypothetical protein
LVKKFQPLQHVHNNLQQAKRDNFFSKVRNSPRFRFNKIFPRDFTQWIPFLHKGGGTIQVDVGGKLPFPLNQHFKPMVLINQDIHPFGGEWNVIPYSFVN